MPLFQWQWRCRIRATRSGLKHLRAADATGGSLRRAGGRRACTPRASRGGFLLAQLEELKLKLTRKPELKRGLPASSLPLSFTSLERSLTDHWQAQYQRPQAGCG
jgi:hypothetical protein